MDRFSQPLSSEYRRRRPTIDEIEAYKRRRDIEEYDNEEETEDDNKSDLGSGDER